MLQLVFMENFHKIAGELFITVRYAGTGAPITEEEKAEEKKKEEAMLQKQKEEEDKKRQEDAKRREELHTVVQQVQDQANKFIADYHHKNELEKAELKAQKEATEAEMKKKKLMNLKKKKSLRFYLLPSKQSRRKK